MRAFISRAVDELGLSLGILSPVYVKEAVLSILGQPISWMELLD